MMQPINDPTVGPVTSTGSNLQQEHNALETKTREARDKAKQKAQQAYHDMRQGTRKIVTESGSYLKKVVGQQQHFLVEKLEEYRDAAKAASDKLETDDDTVASKNIRKASDGLESAADYLRESDPNDLLSDASRMARKRPELVFGSLFLVGLGMARLMKSSARERRHDELSSNGGTSSGMGNTTTTTGSTLGIRPMVAPATPVATFGE